MEQYLNGDGTEKLCGAYDVPKEEPRPCRVAFFIYKTGAGCLHTPYGDFKLGSGDEMPLRLKSIIEFE